MKKFIFGLIALVMFGFVGNAQSTTEPLYGKDVTISNSNLGKSAGVGFLLDLGRSSRHCRGFGICDVVAFWIVIYKGAPPTSNQVVVDVKGEKGNEFLLVELNNSLNPLDFDTNLYVDSDLKSIDNEAVIKRGTYKLDSTIGNFGGYKIPVTSN